MMILVIGKWHLSNHDRMLFAKEWRDALEQTPNLDFYQESSNIDRYDKLVEENNGSLRFSEWYYGPQKRLFISPQFKFFLGKKWLKKGTMTFAYQKVDESRVNRKFGEISRSNKLESVDVLSLNTDFFGYSKGGHSYSYGLELTHNKINSEAYPTEEDPKVTSTLSILWGPIVIAFCRCPER